MGKSLSKILTGKFANYRLNCSINLTGKIPVIYRLCIGVSIFLAVTGKEPVKKTYIPVNYWFFFSA